MKTKKIKYFFIFLFILSSYKSISQGYMMLAGGGAEAAGGWSDAPYKWVVDHATNKRIAIITYDESATNWIPNYFKSFGAVWSRNFILSGRNNADIQSVYDSLITYDGIFIKGGDQKLYYQYYNDTKTEEAIQYVYNHGGVISGTSAGTAIQSPVVYTAESVSVDPATALMNAYTSQITLAEDFLSTLQEKYIFDTHFAERGRFGRLPSFLAKWYRNTRENIKGIGVDDHTALCIQPNGLAFVYGTGAVSFFENNATAMPYDTTFTMLRTKDLQFTQLLHGCTIDLNTGAKTGLQDFISPPVNEENRRLRIFFSGTDYPSSEAYEYFVNQAGFQSDAIVIVTGSDLTRANDVKSNLLQKGASSVNIIQATSTYQNDANVQNLITNARKFFIISNDYTVFTTFINGNGNGLLLKEKLKQNEMISFFAGDNARFAGKTVVNNYVTSGASYNGNLQFLPGLGLLETTAIMPNAFINANTYENTVSGLPYAMFTDSLKFGLYITGITCAEYGFTSGNKSYFKNISGSFPLIYLRNDGTKSAFAKQGPYAKSRNIAGFDLMTLRFLGTADTVITGQNVPTSAMLTPKLDVKIFPNPAKNYLNIDIKKGKYSLKMLDISGKIVIRKEFFSQIEIDLGKISEGIYIVQINDLNNKTNFNTKLYISK